MVRGTVIVNSVKEMWDAYKFFKAMPNLDGILSIQDQLDGDLKQMTVVFSHYESLIGEVCFRCGAIPP